MLAPALTLGTICSRPQSSGARAAWLPGASDTDEGRIRQRATAAVLGALVADAATMALHVSAVLMSDTCYMV